MVVCHVRQGVVTNRVRGLCDRTTLVAWAAVTTLHMERTSGLATGTISTTRTCPVPTPAALCLGWRTCCSTDDGMRVNQRHETSLASDC